MTGNFCSYIFLIFIYFIIQYNLHVKIEMASDMYLFSQSNKGGLFYIILKNPEIKGFTVHFIFLN